MFAFPVRKAHSSAKWAALAVGLLLPFASPAHAGICKTRDLMPEYFAFEAKAGSLPLDARVSLFMREIVAAHPAFYTGEEFGDARKIRRSAARFLDRSKPVMLGGFGPLTRERLRAVADNVMPAFDAEQTAFAGIFPDFRCEADIAFGISLLHFDGHGYEDDQGREHMRFGIDMIALLHPPQELPAFFAHELFHLYHAQVLGASPEDDARTWWAMWAEGLATYVSRRMNAPLTEQQVLWFPADLASRMEKRDAMRRAAREMLADFNTTGHYADWFEAGHSAPGLPPRAGYFMGLRLAEQLGRTRSLYQLAHLTPAQIKPLAKAFLEREARR